MNENSIKIWNFGSAKSPLDLKLMFLIQGLLAMGVHDLYSGRQDMVFSIGIPAVFYILGVYLSRIYHNEKPFGAYITIALMTAITAVKGLVELFFTYKSEYWASGYYLQLFTGELVEQNEITFDFIMLMAIILAILIVVKPSKIKTIAILSIAAIVGLFLFRHQLMDGRLNAIIEAIGLTLAYKSGGFTVTALGINTSHCMWLDYARDYGIIILSMLGLFELLTLIEAIRFAKNTSRNRFLTYTLVISYALLTIFYLLESSPISHKYIWYEGLVISGMMTGLRKPDDNFGNNVKEISLIYSKRIVTGNDEKIEKIIFCAICASLFTYGFCYPIINELVAGAFMGVLVMIEIFRQRYLPIDFAALLLIEVMFAIALIDYMCSEYWFTSLRWAWVLPLGYLLGKAAVGSYADADKRSLAAYASLTAGMLMQGLVDHTYGFMQMAEVGEFLSGWNQFWTKENEVRTTFQLGFLLTISLIGVAVYIYRKNKALSILLIVVNVIIQICAYLTSGRQPIIYMGLLLIIVAALNLYDKKFKVGQIEKWIYRLLAIFILAVALLAIAFYKFRFFGLVEIDTENMWLRDGGILHNIRFEVDAEAIKMLPNNPLGGYECTILDHGISHSMLTEYAREWGLMPFALLVIFSVLILVEALRLAFSRKINVIVKYTLFPAFICINLYHLMEPNAHAHRNFWLFGLFISGMIRRINEIQDCSDKVDMT